MNKEITTRICDELLRIEQTENVTVLYACESGSRAWGFESEDSDYDVRFIYLRRTEWYFTIQNKRDVIDIFMYSALFSPVIGLRGDWGWCPWNLNNS
jgi:predicted nucleotidyltransferase